MQMRDIDFLIIGATKSATTWLQQSLQQDPGIFMPDPELHYFSRYYDRGDQWYLDHFAGQEHRRLRPLKPVAAPFRQNTGFKKLRSLVAGELQYAPLSHDLRERMTDYFAPETEKLGALVGKDLTNWLRNRSLEK